MRIFTDYQSKGGQHFLNRISQGPAVYLPGKMHRALAVDRVPAGRIGITVELGIKTDFSNRILHRRADGAPGGLPRGSTRSAANNADIRNNTLFNLYLKFRSTEALTIVSKADLPWQSTSGGRR